MPRISLSALVLIILSITVFLYLPIGGVGYWRLQTVLTELEARRQQAAAEEFTTAIANLQARVQTFTGELAAWEEVRQQLRNPTYYAYWLENRLQTSARIPAWVHAVALYLDTGQPVLAPLATPLPQVLYNPGVPLLASRQGKAYLVFSAPVLESGQAGPIGYVALAVEIVTALQALQATRYVDLASVRATIPEDTQIASTDLANKFRFELLPSAETAKFADLLSKSFYQIAGITLVILCLLYLAAIFFIVLPLHKLSRHIDRMRNGHDVGHFGISESFAIIELEKIRQSLNEYQSRLEVVHRGLDRKNQRLWKLAHHDSLTGCLNRRAFEDDWRRLVKLNAERAADVSLVLIDCNHFKAINDSYGHDIGDEILKSIAITVRKILSPGDRLYRIAGDEFAVIFMDAGPEHAQQVAQRCLASIGQYTFASFGVREPIRISIGIAHTFSGDVNDLMSLYRRANIAMFNAKRPGTPGIAVYTPDMNGHVDLAFSSRAAAMVDEALNTGKNLLIHYQPVVTLQDRKISYYESLVRVRDGDTLIKPEEFFLQVETRHLDAEFDNAVFNAVLRDLKSGCIAEGFGLSVNVSAASIVAPDIEARLAMFTPYFKRHKFILEVTETTLITQLQLASERLARLRKLGFSVALDDFGSGYSSLRYLADMPVDVIKFDISLVQAMCEHTPRAEMLARLVALVRQPGYTLVAEGIETEAMAERIVDLGFDYGQGYFFGEPSALRIEN